MFDARVAHTAELVGYRHIAAHAVARAVVGNAVEALCQRRILFNSA